MKFGIITIHKKVNYGATFQALALLTFIKKYISDDVELIDYRMNSSRSGNEFNSISRNIQVKFQYITHFFSYIKSKRRDQYFRDFWDKNYSLSQEMYDGDASIYSNPPKYDVYISGSDQLFNGVITNNSEAFFLTFTDNRKISYSTSFGMAGLLAENKNDVIKKLGLYSAISVREQSAAESLSESMHKVISVVADPVFLLSRQEWTQFERRIQLPSKYIFCYLMSDNSNILPTIEWLRTTIGHNIPVVLFKTCSEKLHIKNCKNYSQFGPAEFLYCLRNADYVVTNSFHGTALSLIFGKQCFCLEEEKYINDQRYVAMLNHGQVYNRIVPYSSDWDRFNFSEHLICGENAYLNMVDWISESKEFLYENLLNEKTDFR